MLAQARIMGLGLQVRLSIPVYFSVEGREIFSLLSRAKSNQAVRYMQNLHPCRASLLRFQTSGSFCIKTTTKRSLISRDWVFAFAAQDSEAEGSLGNLAVVG